MPFTQQTNPFDGVPIGGALQDGGGVDQRGLQGEEPITWQPGLVHRVRDGAAGALEPAAFPFRLRVLSGKLEVWPGFVNALDPDTNWSGSLSSAGLRPISTSTYSVWAKCTFDRMLNGDSSVLYKATLISAEVQVLTSNPTNGGDDWFVLIGVVANLKVTNQAVHGNFSVQLCGPGAGDGEGVFSSSS